MNIRDIYFSTNFYFVILFGFVSGTVMGSMLLFSFIKDGSNIFEIVIILVIGCGCFFVIVLYVWENKLKKYHIAKQDKQDAELMRNERECRQQK